MQFSNEVVIQRPLHAVFAFVADLENVPRWNYAITDTRKTSPGPIGPGTTYRQLRSIPQPSQETLVITDYQPDRRLALEGDLGPLRGTLAYEFERTDEGTRLTNTADLSAAGAARLAEPLLAGRIRGAVAKNLDALKTLLESES